MLADIHRLVLDLKTAPEAKCLSKVTIIRDRIRIKCIFQSTHNNNVYVRSDVGCSYFLSLC